MIIPALRNYLLLQVITKVLGTIQLQIVFKMLLDSWRFSQKDLGCFSGAKVAELKIDLGALLGFSGGEGLLWGDLLGCFLGGV